ncbi:hypothetical protein WDW37_07830 [Bdellovibrionota bacterium FG-1]
MASIRFRIFPLACVVFATGVMLMGVLADPTVFQPQPIRSASSTGSGEVLADLTQATHGGLQHWRRIYYFSTHIPEVCWANNAVNEFQKKQCGEFWEHLEYGVLLSFLPWAIGGLFWSVMMRSYRRVRKQLSRRIASQKPVSRGVITSPAEAPSEFFGWFYDLRAMGVQLSSGEQIKVFIAKTDAVPRPGQTMLVYESIMTWGGARWVGTVHTPHLAVVPGVRGV